MTLPTCQIKRLGGARSNSGKKRPFRFQCGFHPQAHRPDVIGWSRSIPGPGRRRKPRHSQHHQEQRKAKPPVDALLSLSIRDWTPRSRPERVACQAAFAIAAAWTTTFHEQVEAGLHGQPIRNLPNPIHPDGMTRSPLPRMVCSTQWARSDPPRPPAAPVTIGPSNIPRHHRFPHGARHMRGKKCHAARQGMF